MKDDSKKIWKVLLTALTIGGVGFFAFALVLQPFFSGKLILPQFVLIGNFKLQFYGVILGIAAIVGYGLAMRRKNKYSIATVDTENILLIALIAGFIGARLYHVLSEIPYYYDHPELVIAIWNGGLSIYGAAIGGAVGLWLYCRRSKKYTIPQLLDWLVPSLALGQIIGRLGNFLNYELYGLPTSLPWKMHVPPQFRLPPYEVYQYFHPLFLYEIAGSIVIFILLLRLNLTAGRLFLLWLLLYNVMRFFLEFLRIDSVVYGGIRVNAIVSLVLAVIALAFWYRINQSKNVLSNSSHS